MQVFRSRVLSFYQVFTVAGWIVVPVHELFRRPRDQLTPDRALPRERVRATTRSKKVTLYQCFVPGAISLRATFLEHARSPSAVTRAKLFSAKTNQ